ncbi:MAG: hypothetical protein NDI81_09450 [Desulfobacula sp.]|nr:hypothetical protein [Desulfobacula sp.]
MNITPQATIEHRMTGRIRIRITGPARPKNEYFETLEALIKKEFNFQTVLIRPGTGSMVLKDPNLDLEALARFGQSQGLFLLETGKTSSRTPVTGHSKRYIKKLNHGIRKISGGRLDMSSSIFFLLIFHAMGEIIRGNLALPSWFTALWFASTLYNRDILNSGDADGHPHADGHDGDASE